MGNPPVISQNDTSLPVTTFLCFRRMSTLPWRHFMKFIEKIPNLEDPYLEFYNSVWPLVCTVWNKFQLAKTFQKIRKSENAQKYHKNDLFYVHVSFLKETHVRTWLSIHNTRVHLQKMSKKYVFQNLGSLGSYATDSFSCNYFAFDPNSSLSI